MSTPGVSLQINPLGVIQANVISIAVGLVFLSLLVTTVVYFYKKGRATQKNAKDIAAAQVLVIESTAAALGHNVGGLSSIAKLNTVPVAQKQYVKEGFESWADIMSRIQEQQQRQQQEFIQRMQVQIPPPPVMIEKSVMDNYVKDTNVKIDDLNNAVHFWETDAKDKGGKAIEYLTKMKRKGEEGSALYSNITDDMSKIETDMMKLKEIQESLHKPRVGPGPAKADGKSLLNLQPVTVKQTGYVGPLESGVFKENDFVKNALKAGCRSFILQIDSYEGNPKPAALFPGPNEPCLLYRDDSGILISVNSGSIQKVATAIADFAFSGPTPSNTDPVLVILNIVSSPNPITSPKEYLAYCSKIAVQLKPLIPYHLGLTTTGDYHRQQLEADLFKQPLKSFEKNVIILTTADTTLFRNTSKLNIPQYHPYADLDFYTNARLYKETLVSSHKKDSYGRIVDIDTLVALSPDEQANWVLKNKGLFTVVLPKMMSNLSVASVDALINKMGVNVVPLDIFNFPIEETKPLLAIWKNQIWNMKPPALVE